MSLEHRHQKLCSNCSSIITTTKVCKECKAGPFCSECLIDNDQCQTCFILTAMEPPRRKELLATCHGNNLKENQQVPPNDIHRKYTYEDFEQVFNVKATHEILFDKNLVSLLDEKDIKLDPEYLESIEYSQILTKEYASFIQLKGPERAQRETSMFYVMWSGIEIGYGLFAKRAIRKGEIIGMYCGRVSLNQDDDNTGFIKLY